ncbi:MAG: transposase [Deltaproteobacteria bacterium]|nr:transposase [Deltaproteobacteria bacterium]
MFRHKVLKLPLKEKKISQEWVQRLFSWRNSGFNIHNQVKIGSQDKRGQESLAQYILRSPFSQQKMTYRKDTQTVLYRSKMNPNLKRNFALFPVLDWIAEIATHIPNKGEQLVLTMAPTVTSSGERERRRKSKKNRPRSRRSPLHPSPGS